MQRLFLKVILLLKTLIDTDNDVAEVYKFSDSEIVQMVLNPQPNEDIDNNERAD